MVRTRMGHDDKPAESKLAPKPVGAVLNAIEILRYLAAAKDPLGVTRIARDLRINPSTCFNILRTLATEGLVDFDPLTRTYRIGMGVVTLARGALESDRAAEMLRAAMTEIAFRYSVTVSLWRRTNRTRMTLISVVERPATTISIRMNLGHRLPILAGALGRIVAGSGEFAAPELRQLFDEIRWQQSPGFDTFLAEAKLAAERGWAVDNGTLVRGALTLAAPVWAVNRHDLELTVNASMFEQQHDDATVARIAAELQTVAELVRRLPSP